VWDELPTLLLKEGELACVYGQLKENYNKSFGEYNFIVSHINMLTFINNDDKYIVINIDDKSQEDLNKITKMLANINNECYNNNTEIKYVVCLQRNGKLKILNSDMWVNNKKILMEKLFYKNMI